MFVQGSGAAHAAAATHDRPNTSMDDTGTPAADHVDADGGFTKHKATIARLYLAEGRTLDDVRDIMTKTHHFTASYVDRCHQRSLLRCLLIIITVMFFSESVGPRCTRAGSKNGAGGRTFALISPWFYTMTLDSSCPSNCPTPDPHRLFQQQQQQQQQRR